MKLRYYMAFGPCEEVEGKWLGLRHVQKGPVIGIELTDDVVINGRRVERGKILYGDVLSVYTKVEGVTETILWNPREHVNDMLLHQKEFLATNSDYPDLENLDPGQAARQKVHVFEDFTEKSGEKGGVKRSRKVAARKTSKKARKKGKG